MSRIVSKKELYDLIWEKPISKITDELKLPNGKISKICKELNIPLPPNGYWSNDLFKKKVQKPELSIDNNQNITLYEEYEEELLFLSDEERKFLIDKLKNIVIPDRLIKTHELIKEHMNKDENKSSEKHNFYGYYDSSYRIKNKYLSISCSKEYIRRAYIILNTLFNTLEDLGCKIKLVQDTRNYHYGFDYNVIEIRNQEIEFHLTEKNGLLTFVIDNWDATRKNFSDGIKQKLDDELPNIIVELFLLSERIRVRREKHEREEQERKLKEEEKRLFQERLDSEKKKLDKLILDSNNYALAKSIREYVSCLESKDGLSEDEIEYIAWAKKKANWLDPANKEYDEILDNVIKE